jgi:glutamyl-tRNA reductase
VSEALSDAAAVLGGSLAGSRAVVVGAGAMGALAAAHLRRAGAAEIVVLNRTAERAKRLADNVTAQGTPARAGALETLAAELAVADVLVACTGAVGTVVERTPVAAAVVARAGRPLAVCDLGLPRDVDASVAELAGVTMIDLVALQRRLAAGERGAAVAAAQELVAEEAQAYLAAQRSAEVTPTVTALRRRASEVIDAELLRLDSRLPELDAKLREEFGRSVRRVVDKLLHTPTVQVKRLAEGPDGDSYAAALRALFELDPHTPAAVALQRSGDVLGALEARVDGASAEEPKR